jgi:hypothetical protein
MTNALTHTALTYNPGKRRLNLELSQCTIKMECFISKAQPGLNNVWNTKPESGMNRSILLKINMSNAFPQIAIN